MEQEMEYGWSIFTPYSLLLQKTVTFYGGFDDLYGEVAETIRIRDWEQSRTPR